MVVAGAADHVTRAQDVVQAVLVDVPRVGSDVQPAEVEHVEGRLLNLRDFTLQKFAHAPRERLGSAESSARWKPKTLHQRIPLCSLSLHLLGGTAVPFVFWLPESPVPGIRVMKAVVQGILYSFAKTRSWQVNQLPRAQKAVHMAIRRYIGVRLGLVRSEQQGPAKPSAVGEFRNAGVALDLDMAMDQLVFKTGWKSANRLAPPGAAADGMEAASAHGVPPNARPSGV